jgi:hypothetical protein
MVAFVLNSGKQPTPCPLAFWEGNKHEIWTGQHSYSYKPDGIAGSFIIDECVLTIYVNGKRTFDVEAGKTVNGATVMITTDRFTIKARNAEGKIFYSHDYSLNQLEAMHIR